MMNLAKMTGVVGWTDMDGVVDTFADISVKWELFWGVEAATHNACSGLLRAADRA